jgi:uncharacterized protein (TIGR03086 family)
MELDFPELHSRALDATRRIVSGVGDDQWTTRVETSNTDVRTLVNHFVSESYWVEPLLSGETFEQVGKRYSGDVLGEDPIASYDRSAASAAAAFRAPGALEKPCHLRASEPPLLGSALCVNRFVDVLVHGWEVANATGQDTRLDPELAEAARVGIEPDIVKLREKGIIRGALDVPADASSQTKLLAFFGFKG